MDILESSFTGQADVWHDADEKLFVIKPTDPNLVNAFIFLAAGNQELLPAYQTLRAKHRDLSKEIARHLPEHKVAISNPFDDDLLYLVAWDGFILYDFMEGGY